jgi:hypothetical protein
VCHNRKRRPRASQELYGSNTSTDSSIPFAKTSVNGQSRKKSDLSCVGKLFKCIFHYFQLVRFYLKNQEIGISYIVYKYPYLCPS